MTVQNIVKKLLNQYISQAIHTDFADRAKTINIKNVIKRAESVKL